MDDPHNTVTPHPDGDQNASSVPGMDGPEFYQLREIEALRLALRKSEQEKQEMKTAFQLQIQKSEQEKAESNKKVETLLHKNLLLARDFDEYSKAASDRSAELLKEHRVSEDRRLLIRALKARLKRKTEAKQAEVPRRYTRVLPEQMIGASLEQQEEDVLVMSTDSLAATSCPTPGRGMPRRWKYHKIGTDHSMVKMPPAFVKRGGKNPGIVANPTQLAAKVMTWAKYGHISLAAVSNAMADEVEAVSEDVWVQASRSNGAARRTLPGDQDKPLDVAGRYANKTLSDAVHAFQMTCDGIMARKLLSADVLHTEVDISTFGTYHMQSMVLHAAWVVPQEADAAGSLSMAIRSRLSFLPSIPVGDKIVRAIVDDEGKEMATSTGRAAATSLILAGLPGIINHGCRSWGVDGGGEGEGAQHQNGRAGHTSNKNGFGSYRNVMDVTREGFEQAMAKNGPILNQVMNLLGVPEDEIRCMEARPTAKTLTPVERYMSCPRVLVIRKRDASYEKGRPVWTEQRIRETLPSRPSMRRDPLPCMAMVKGGVALVFDCTKHLAHTAAQHSYKLMIPFVKDLASVILALCNVWIHTRILAWIGKVFSLADCGPISSLQEGVAQGLKAINTQLYESYQNVWRSVKKIKKVTEACETRWGAISKGALECSQRLMAVAVMVPLALAEGTEESRLKSAVSVWSKDGFSHEGKLRFSPKNGRLCWRLTDPGFIFGTHMTAFFEKCCNSLILAATSDHKERCALSIGGVGSVLRRTLFFLARLMWVVLPVHADLCSVKWEDVLQEIRKIIKDKKEHKPNDRRRLWSLIMLLTAPAAILKRKPGRNTGVAAWEMMYPLQYKGIVNCNPTSGLLMLNPTVGISPSAGGESPLKHCYGPFYREGMANMISDMIQIINSVSELKFQDGERNYLPKGTIRDKCRGSQRYPFERRQVMLKALFLMSRATIDALLNKFYHVLIDPHLFLACAAKTEIVRVKDNCGSESVYHIATDEALANAALFQIQIEEIEQAYASQLDNGELLGHFCHGPLRNFLLDPSCRNDLSSFRSAENASLDHRWVESGRSDPARAAFKPKPGLAYANILATKRPKPLTAYPHLAKLAYKVMAQPRTQNRVEGGFSIASGEFRAGKRNQKGEMWSAVIRKKNVWNQGLQAFVRKREFSQKLGVFLAFRRVNRHPITKLFEPDLGESEQKMEARMRSDLPEYVKAGGSFEKTNICDRIESDKVLKAPDRNGGAAQNIRHRGLSVENNQRGIEADKQQQRPARKRKSVSSSDLNLNKSIRYNDGDDIVRERGDEQTISDPAADDSMMYDPVPADPLQDSENVAVTNAEIPVLPDLSVPVARAASGEDEPDCRTAEHVSPESCRGLESGRAQMPEDDDAAWINGCIAAQGEDFFGDSEDEIDPKVLDEMEASLAILNKKLEHGETDSDSEEEEAAKPLSVDKLPDVQARKVGLYKREYAEALAMSRSWRRCEIIETKVARADKAYKQQGTPLAFVKLQRSDGIEFKAKVSRQLFYILRNTAGVELIRIAHIFQPSNSTTVMLSYSRILCSSEAILASDRSDDLIETVRRSNGQEIISRRFGSNGISRQLEERKRTGKQELYHWGDVPWEAKAVDLVGVVYWLPLSSENGFNQEQSLKKCILKAAQEDFSNAIKNLGELDRVVVGEPFSESARQ